MRWLADGSASTIVFLAAMCAAILILLRRWSRYYRRSPRDASPLVHVKRPNQTDRSRPRDADAERIRAEVALHETARELSAKLDSKIRVLEYLTGTAEGQILRLEVLLDEAQRIDSAETADRSETEKPADQ